MNSLKNSVILSVNSDMKKVGQIGARTYRIAEECEKKGYLKTVICRDYEKTIRVPFEKIKKPIPLGNLVPKICTGIRAFLLPNFPARTIQIWLYETFGKKHVNDAKIFYSVEYAPKMLKKAKQQGMTTILDVAIGYAQYYIDLKKKYNLTTDSKDDKIDGALPKSLALADYFIVPSPFVRDTLLQANVKKEKIFIVPFGVDLKRFTPRKQPKKFRVVYLGMVNYRKGIQYLLEAWKQLDLKDAELLLIGHVYKGMRQLIKEYQQECPTIKTPGYMDNKKAMSLASVYCIPSLMEGSSKTVYEAMATGIPVITTYNAGSIIQDGKDGFIVPIMDAPALGKKIQYFYENRKAIDVMGKSARKHVEKYPWERYSKDVVKIFERKVY